MSIYTDNGYKNRADYLQQLADEYDVPIELVRLIADLLGPNEDFDGLVTSIQEAKDFI